VLLYDDRYLAAAAILPVLMLGAWFGTLATLADSVLLGIGKPGVTATANAAKLAWMASNVPFALSFGTFQWAVLAIAAAEIVRYFVLSAANYRHGLSFFRQDIAHNTVMPPGPDRRRPRPGLFRFAGLGPIAELRRAAESRGAGSKLALLR